MKLAMSSINDTNDNENTYGLELVRSLIKNIEKEDTLNRLMYLVYGGYFLNIDVISDELKKLDLCDTKYYKASIIYHLLEMINSSRHQFYQTQYRRTIGGVFDKFMSDHKSDNISDDAFYYAILGITEPDSNKALKILKKSADMGSCWGYYFMNEYHTNKPKNIEYYKKAAEMGCAMAYYKIGKHHIQDDDKGEYTQFYLKAGKGGFASGYYKYAKIKFGGHNGNNEKEFMKYFYLAYLDGYQPFEASDKYILSLYIKNKKLTDKLENNTKLINQMIAVGQLGVVNGLASTYIMES